MQACRWTAKWRQSSIPVCRFSLRYRAARCLLSCRNGRVNADLSQLAKLMDRAVPRKLWTIDQPRQTCVASQKVKILFVKIETPILKCRIIGVVSRGPLALSGAGLTIFVTMPLHAVVSALDIGGILKRETATADARVRAIVRLDVAPDWSPRGTVSIAYDWATWFTEVQIVLGNPR